MALFKLNGCPHNLQVYYRNHFHWLMTLAFLFKVIGNKKGQSRPNCIYAVGRYDLESTAGKGKCGISSQKGTKYLQMKLWKTREGRQSTLLEGWWRNDGLNLLCLYAVALDWELLVYTQPLQDQRLLVKLLLESKAFNRWLREGLVGGSWCAPSTMGFCIHSFRASRVPMPSWMLGCHLA